MECADNGRIPGLGTASPGPHPMEKLREVLRKNSRVVVTMVCALSLPPSWIRAQVVPADSSSLKVEIHGMVATSFFLQDNSFGFGNGQNATFVANRSPTDDPWILGGDVRNSRVRMDLTGLPLDGAWDASAHLEVDFFGGFNGTGAFSDEQAHLRLRSAYVEIQTGNTSFRLGQAFALLLGNVPASVSHIAFPLGYGSAGVIGWRHPGLFFTQRLRSSPTFGADLKVAALRGSWKGPGDNLDQESAGETAAFPQLEVRLDLRGVYSGGLRWSAYTVVHRDRKDLSGIHPPEGRDDVLDGEALEFGGRLDVRSVTFHGNAYSGRAIGQQLGQLTQFGDVRSRGAWGQVGYQLTSLWSAWFFMGSDNPDDDDIRKMGGAARVRNDSWASMIRYASGPISMGLEWMGVTTRWTEGGEGVRLRKGNQFSLSAVYKF